MDVAAQGRRNAKPKSRQTRILRRKMTLHTVLAWAIYSALFVAFALFANIFIVPKIADFVVERTATTVDYDPEYYLTYIGPYHLLDWYLQRLDEHGTEYELTLYDSDMEAKKQAEQEPTGEAAATDETQAAEGQEINEAPASIADDAADSPRIDPDEPLGVIEYVSSPGYADEAIAGEIIALTPRYLAQQAIEQDFSELQAQGGEWQVLPLGYMDGKSSGAFQAREISFYNTVKQLKIPIAIMLYLVGCLVVIMMEMRRAMGYFDQLAGAVAGLIADRRKPVQLSKELALAQDELNNIRIEALNDERVAQRAEERKNELVAYLAHDIRTPLTSIIGYLSMLDESPDLPEDARRRFTHTAFAKAESLEGLINEFFEITRYNLQKIPIERSWVSAHIMLQQLADEFLPQAAERGVAIRVSTPEDAMLFVDAAKLARALENVLRNAIAYAYTDTEVDVTASPVEDAGANIPGESHAPTAEEHADTDAHGWKITVTDTGREISEAHLESIFEKFYREDAARSTDGGAGLGLAIAKEIVAAHGGTIAAASAAGKTTFTITLPCESALTATAEADTSGNP